MEVLGKVLAFIICIPFAFYGLYALFAGVVFVIAGVLEFLAGGDKGGGLVAIIMGFLTLIVSFCIYVLFKFIWA